LAGIRVAYTGFITFGGRIASILTGLIFTVIVTRQLSVEEFGTWGLINGIIVYAIIIHPIISYWSTRETARGEKSGKTAISTTSLFSTVGIGIYILIAYFVGLQSNAEVNILIFAGILVPVIFINEGLNAIITGFKPHVRSYGFMVFEITKIPIALLLVYYFQWGLEGAIIASVIAYLSSIIILFSYAKEKLRSKLNKKYVIKWKKLFWIPLYRTAPSLISMSDVIVFSVITGSVVGVAYYTAARTIGFLVTHSRAIGSGVYPKLLEGGNEKILQNNLIQFFYVAFPLMALSIILAKPGLFALNPIYTIAVPVVILLSLRQFLTTMNLLLFQSLQGIEKVDLDEKSTFKDYAKSKLILFPTFQMIRHGIYIGSLIIILVVINNENTAEIDLVFYWALIGLIIEIPLFTYILKLTKKSFTLKLDFKSILKYLGSCIIIFGIIYGFMEEYLVYENNIFEFLPKVIIFGMIGTIFYIIMTYLIDKKTKILVKSVIKELTKK
jgi:O-antigen/teichoic acid export membrane protein